MTWQVGGGSVASSVNILLSTDGGASWQTLAAGTPNDGSESVSAVVTPTRTTCRVKVEALGNIFYDVSDQDFTILEPVTGIAGGLPRVPAITALTPNPSPGSIGIDYAIPRAGVVRLAVLDVQGRVVSLLAHGRREAGRHRATWNAGGSAGLFFVVLEGEGVRVVRRAVLTP